MSGAPRQYPTYDEWLQAQGLPPDTIPTPIGVTNVPLDYRLYTRNPSVAKTDPNYNLYQKGERFVYGTHKEDGKDLPIHGPSEWHHWYPNYASIGPETNEPFANSDRFVNILGSFGYTLGEPIAIGKSGNFDNQIWRVSKGGPEQNTPVVNYACKIVHVRNYEELGLPGAVRQILKEATILLNINHESIIRIFENLFIEDTESMFPYVFVASVMELMSGTVDHLLENCDDWVLPEEQHFGFVSDCAQGINFLHNEIRGPAGQWMRVVHMAIRTANILYISDATANRNKFKLADFEECIVYDRNFRPELWNQADPDDFPPDVLPDFNQIPYCLPVSALEITEAAEEDADRTELHLMPNDVFCFATSIAYCLVDNKSVGSDRVDALFEILGNILMSEDDDPPEPNSLNHLLMVACRPDPSERATIAEILAHPYLNSVH